MTLTQVKTLYDQDFALWIDETVKQLKQGDFSQIDLENLIDEVEALGKSQRKAVRSYLLRLLEHLLKRYQDYFDYHVQAFVITLVQLQLFFCVAYLRNNPLC